MKKNNIFFIHFTGSVREPRALRAGSDSWSYSSFFQTLRNYFGHAPEPENLLSGSVSTHAGYEFPIPNNIQFVHRPPVQAIK